MLKIGDRVKSVFGRHYNLNKSGISSFYLGTNNKIGIVLATTSSMAQVKFENENFFEDDNTGWFYKHELILVENELWEIIPSHVM